MLTETMESKINEIKTKFENMSDDEIQECSANH